MNQTFQNSAQVLSIGIFFTLMIIGLAATLPHTMSAGLEAHGARRTPRTRSPRLPPVSILFAAFLGYNPVEHLLGPHVLAGLPAHDQAALTGHAFFPMLISGPFRDGLHAAFLFRDRRLPDRGGRVVHARRRATALGRGRIRRRGAGTSAPRRLTQAISSRAPCAPAPAAGARTRLEDRERRETTASPHPGHRACGLGGAAQGIIACSRALPVTLSSWTTRSVAAVDHEADDGEGRADGRGRERDPLEVGAVEHQSFDDAPGAEDGHAASSAR